MAKFFRQFSDEKNKKKSKQIGQGKVALTITGAGVVARKLTFSNNISELLDGAPPAPRWLFDYITVTSHVAGLSRTRIVSTTDRTADTVTVKQSQRRLTSPTSKMFRQHLKCSLTAPRRAGTSFGSFLFLFTQPAVWAWETWYSVVWASQPTCKRHDLQRPWYADGWLLFIFNLSSAESRGTWKGWRTFAWIRMNCQAVVRRHWLFFFFFFNAYAEERTRREGRQNSPLASQ